MSTDRAGEQERGREAEVPSEIPKAGWRDILLRLRDAVREDRITLIAAGVAFYAMLALFPAMIVVVSIYGLVLDPGEIAAQVRALGVLPELQTRRDTTVGPPEPMGRRAPMSPTTWPDPPTTLGRGSRIG